MRLAIKDIEGAVVKKDDGIYVFIGDWYVIKDGKVYKLDSNNLNFDTNNKKINKKMRVYELDVIKYYEYNDGKAIMFDEESGDIRHVDNFEEIKRFFIE